VGDHWRIPAADVFAISVLFAEKKSSYLHNGQYLLFASHINWHLNRSLTQYVADTASNLCSYTHHSAATETPDRLPQRCTVDTPHTET